MALTSGTGTGVTILKAPNSVDSLGLALVLFTISGTYDTSAHSSLVGVPTLIQNSTRNGKTVTMRAVAAGQHTYRSSDGTAFGLSTAAISSSDVTFNLTKSTTSAYGTTEFDNSTAIPTLTGMLGILVVYTEA